MPKVIKETKEKKVKTPKAPKSSKVKTPKLPKETKLPKAVAPKQPKSFKKPMPMKQPAQNKSTQSLPISKPKVYTKSNKDSEVTLTIDIGSKYLKLCLFEVDKEDNTYELIYFTALDNAKYSYRLINKLIKTELEKWSVTVDRIILMLVKPSGYTIDYLREENWENRGAVHASALSKLKSKSTEKTNQFKVCVDDYSEQYTHLDICGYTYKPPTFQKAVLKDINYKYLNIIDSRLVLLNKVPNSGNSLIIDGGHSGSEILIKSRGRLDTYRFFGFAGKDIEEDLTGSLKVSSKDIPEVRKNLKLSDLQANNCRFVSSMTTSLGEIVHNFNGNIDSVYTTGGISDLDLGSLIKISEDIQTGEFTYNENFLNGDNLPKVYKNFIYTSIEAVDYVNSKKEIIDLNNHLYNTVSKHIDLVGKIVIASSCLLLSYSIVSLSLNNQIKEMLDKSTQQLSNYGDDKLAQLDTIIKDIEDELDGFIYNKDKEDTKVEISNLVSNLTTIKPDTIFINDINYKDGEYRVDISSIDGRDLKIFIDRIKQEEIFSDMKTINKGVNILSDVVIQNIIIVAGE